jgi:hypothetical protein
MTFRSTISSKVGTFPLMTTVERLNHKGFIGVRHLSTKAQ